MSDLSFLDEQSACWLAQHGVMEHGKPMPPCDGRLVRGVYAQHSGAERCPAGAIRIVE